MLTQLKDHFGEPVMPVSKYCEALDHWIEIQKTRTTVEKAKVITNLRFQINKSYLLARLIYGGETFRTELCPIHNGTWDGQAMLLGNCPHRCDGSGYLRAQEDEKPVDSE